MAYGMSVLPFSESADGYSEWAESLIEVGIAAPERAQELPTAADLREAMLSRGCSEPFWPDAESWFYLASESAFETGPTVVDGMSTWIGAVGGVDVQFEGAAGTVDWSGDWSDRIAMYSFDRPDLGAALVVVGAMARRHGPQVLLEDGADELVVIEAATALNEVHVKLMEG